MAVKHSIASHQDCVRRDPTVHLQEVIHNANPTPACLRLAALGEPSGVCEANVSHQKLRMTQKSYKLSEGRKSRYIENVSRSCHSHPSEVRRHANQAPRQCHLSPTTVS